MASSTSPTAPPPSTPRRAYVAATCWLLAALLVSTVAAIAVGAIGRKLLADAARTVADRAGIKLPAPASPAPGGTPP